MPQWEAALPTGAKEEDLLPKRYETFTMDNDLVQWVRCSLLVALSTFVNAGPPHLTAVVPPEFCMGTDREFLLTNFHRHECLVRQLISIGGKHRQLAFCPYCGVINENSETTLSHVRKHLDLLFVCGGCYSKSFPHGLALNKHMRTQCCSMSAIREKTRASRR